MKFEKVDSNAMDLAYEVPAPGISICEFGEGIQKQVNPNSGKTTLRLPFTILEVEDGPEDNVGKKFSHFLPIQTPYGEKQLNSLLSWVGLLEGFSAKFQGEIDPLEDVFLAALQLKLVGKRIKVIHEIQKNQKGKDQVSIVRFEKVNNSGIGKPAPVDRKKTAMKVGQTQATQAEPETDW